MEEIVSKEEIDELKKIKGEVKGMGMRTHADFIIKEEGQEELKKLEDVMAGLGHSIKLKEIKTGEFYPIWLDILTLVVMKKLFNWNDKKFQEMGRFEVKTSSFIRLFLKYLFSPERAIELVPNSWSRYHTVGEFKIVEFSKEKRRAIFRLEKFQCHPLHCQVLIGVLSTTVPMIVNVTNVSCEETKCVHRGDEYHEFLTKW